MFSRTELEISYDGSSCPKTFKKTYMRIAAMFSWNATAALSNMEHYLDGKALTAYNKIMMARSSDTPPYVAPTTTNAFFDAFLLECAPPTSTFLNAFNTRLPLAGESYTKYLAALRDLLNKAIPDLTGVQTNQLLRNRLRFSTSGSVQHHVDFNDTMPLDELVTKLDTIMLTTASQAGIETNYASAQRRGPSGPSSRSRFDGDCNYCYIYGHRESECFKKKRDKNARRDYDQNRDVGGNRGRAQNESYVNNASIDELYENQFGEFYDN
jgi:hypothetical protein